MAAAAVLAVAAAGITWLVASRNNDRSASPTTSRPATTAPATVGPTTATTAAPTVATTAPVTTAAPATTATTTATTEPATTRPATTAPTTTAPGPGSRYIGLAHPGGVYPVGITTYDATTIADGAAVVSWVRGPEGDMFWLERVTYSDGEGAQQLEVLDVVVFPKLEQDVGDIVVTGATRCELDGADVVGVVGIFPSSGEAWLTDPYAVWWADTVGGHFVALPDRTRCVNEGM